MTVWEFCYTDNTWESAPATISVHLTKEGAKKAMRKHKRAAKKEWAEKWATSEDQKLFPFGQHEDWFVREIEVLP